MRVANAVQGGQVFISNFDLSGRNLAGSMAAVRVAEWTDWRTRYEYTGN